MLDELTADNGVLCIHTFVNDEMGTQLIAVVFLAALQEIIKLARRSAFGGHLRVQKILTNTQTTVLLAKDL